MTLETSKWTNGRSPLASLKTRAGRGRSGNRREAKGENRADMAEMYSQNCQPLGTVWKNMQPPCRISNTTRSYEIRKEGNPKWTLPNSQPGFRLGVVWYQEERLVHVKSAICKYQWIIVIFAKFESLKVGSHGKFSQRKIKPQLVQFPVARGQRLTVSDSETLL